MPARSRRLWIIVAVLTICAVVTGGILSVAAADPPIHLPRLGVEASTNTHDQHTTPTPSPGFDLSGNDWTQYRYDATGSGDNDEDMITSNNVNQLKLAWNAGFFAGHPFESTPAVFKGAVYVANGNSLFAIDFTSGNKLWQYDDLPQSGYLSSSVAVDPASGIAYYGSPDGSLYAVNTTTHQLAWRVVLGDPKAGAYIWSSPTLANGKLYIGVASFNDHPCIRGRVDAIDPATGSIDWIHYFVPSNELGGDIWSSVTADAAHNTLLVATGNPCDLPADTEVQGGTSDAEQDAIVGLDWNTGNTLWYYTAVSNDQCDCDFGQGPVGYVMNGKEYVVAGNKLGVLYAVNPPAAGTGATLAWSDTIAQLGNAPGGGIFTPPTYRNGIIYAAGGPPPDGSCPTGEIWALRADTGAVIWNQCTQNEVVGAPAITGNVLFAGQTDTVVAYDATTGKVLWQYHTPGAVWGGINISHGNVLVDTTAGRLYCFHLPHAAK